MEDSTVLELNNVTKSFGGLVAVNDVSLKVSQEETLGIIGPNGAGKTTLFSIICGFVKPDAGEIVFGGKELIGMRPDQICKLGLVRTFQLVQSFPNLTAIENIMIGAFSRDPNSSNARQKAAQWLDFSGISQKKWHIPAKNLTLVDKKRLELARSLATDAKIILADEAMSGLNATEITEVIRFIQKIKQMGITIVLIEHVMKVIMNLSDRIIMLQNGAKVIEGPPGDILKDSSVIKAYLGEENPFV